MLTTLPLQDRDASDPLELPAFKSDKASSVLLLSVTSVGTGAHARLVAVGEHGVIVYSDDQGARWKQADVPVSVTLTAVYFSDANNGWAVGHDGVILHSTTGGRTWGKQFDGNQANSLMHKEAQDNANQAHRRLDSATGSEKSVAQHACDEADNALSDVEAAIKFGPSRPLLGVWFKNNSEGIVVGSYGQIFQTIDDGVHWTSLASRLRNPEGLHYNSISSTSTGAIVIAGEGGKVYRSTDHGANWQTLDTGYQGQLYGVLGLLADQGAEKLLAFGFGGHIFESDASATHWTELTSITKKNLVAGIKREDGRIQLVGQDGSILLSDQQATQFHLAYPGSGLSIAGASRIGTEGKLILTGAGGLHQISPDSEHAPSDAGKSTP